MVKKRIISLTIGLTLLFGFAIGVGAAPVMEKISASLNWSINFSVDGKNWSPADANGKKLAPITYKNTTYLPVRAVSEAVGTAVTWDQKTQTVHLGEKSATTKITNTGMNLGASAFSTSDKQYTVQNGKDYKAGIVFEKLNSAERSFTLKPGGSYQKVNLSFFAIEAKSNLTIRVSHNNSVLKEIMLKPGQTASTDLTIGGMKDIKISAKGTPGGEDKIFITGEYK